MADVLCIIRIQKQTRRIVRYLKTILNQSTDGNKVEDQQIEDLATTKAIVLDMHHRLFGNGQPGEIQVLRAAVTELQAFKNKVYGLVATSGVLTVLMGITTVSKNLGWIK